MDATFLLINICSLIRASIVGSPPILGSIGVRKSARTPSAVLVSPNILSFTLGGIDGGFVHQDN